MSRTAKLLSWAIPGALLLLLGMIVAFGAYFLSQGKEGRRQALSIEQKIIVTEKDILPLSEENLMQEIFILREMGLWTEGDDQIFGFTKEENLADLRLASKMASSVQ